MGRIAVLPVALANQIAAGEVIERPASVVKELVENALDAGARRIVVAVRDGGCALIRVRDDGEGMAREDAVLAFARHATSKIRVSEDLIAIETLGFRGEALASIAAAADVELLTRRADEEVGTRVTARGGVVVDVGDAGSAPGTLVEVREIFAALPARRKFLRRPATEFGHIAEVLSRLALGVPLVGFTLEHDGRRVLDLPPVGNALERVVQVVGREVAQGMTALEVDGSIARLRAHLGRPENSLSTARLVLTYVNGRVVRDRVLTRAVLDGYETLLMRGRYPICVVFLQIAPGEVDVNVHPAKAEVRFRDAGAMHRIIARGIATRLREAMAGQAPRGPGDRAATHSTLPRSEWRRSGPGRSWMGGGESPAVLGRAHEAASPYSTSVPPISPAVVAESAPSPAGADEIGGPAVPAAGGFASLRFLAQVLDGYLVCVGPDGLVIIDQHAAHERVRFERLRAQTDAGAVPAQRLLVPDTLQLGLRDVQALVEAAPLLERLGFEGEAFGGGTYVLRAVPTLLADTDCPAVLRDLAADLAEIGASRAGDEAMDGILARVACHSAVRVGRRLERAEVEALLRAMDEVDRSSYCPHGRPAFLALERGTLERMFKRQ